MLQYKNGIQIIFETTLAIQTSKYALDNAYSLKIDLHIKVYEKENVLVLDYYIYIDQLSDVSTVILPFVAVSLTVMLDSQPIKIQQLEFTIKVAECSQKKGPVV